MPEPDALTAALLRLSEHTSKLTELDQRDATRAAQTTDILTGLKDLDDKVASLASIPNSTDTQDWFNVSMVNAHGATDYPLATFVYLYVYQATNLGFTPSVTRSQVLVQWLDYVLSPTAQAMANQSHPTQLYYTALPASIVSVDQTGIQTMTFNGAAIPGCK